MDLKSIGEFISLVGVPTFLLVIVGKYFAKRDEKNQAELGKMHEIVDNNTKALNELNIAYNNTNIILKEVLLTLQNMKVGERK